MKLTALSTTTVSTLLTTLATSLFGHIGVRDSVAQSSEETFAFNNGTTIDSPSADITSTPIGSIFSTPPSVTRSSSPGFVVNMYTVGQSLTVDVGHEAIELSCEFYSDVFNLFDNPVQWYKTQIDETLPINLMGNLIEPFDSGNRFGVNLLREPPRYDMQLTISDVTKFDSGNYSCQVNGPHNALLASVTHEVIVRLDVTNVVITIEDHDNVTRGNSTISSDRRLVLVESIPIFLRCIARGGYPSTDIRVFVNQSDFTHRSHFELRHRIGWPEEVKGAVPGLRSLTEEVELTTEHFSVNHTHDGECLRCVAMTTGTITSLEDHVILVILHRPVIECWKDESLCQSIHNTTHVSCKIKSRPLVTSLYWLQGYTADTQLQYWTTVTILDDQDFYLRTSLHIQRSMVNVYRTFFVVAYNHFGRTTHRVHIGCKRRRVSSGSRSLRFALTGRCCCCCSIWFLTTFFYLAIATT